MKLAGVCGQCLRVDNREGKQSGPVVGRGAGKDAVVVVGITLGFHQRFAAAIGAPIEVGVLRCRSVELRDDELGHAGHLVNAAMSEVDDLLRMPRPTTASMGEPEWPVSVATAAIAVDDRGTEAVVADLRRQILRCPSPSSLPFQPGRAASRLRRRCRSLQLA